MKIDLFINSLRGGGAERVCVNVANGLVHEGYQVRLNVLNLDRAIYQKDLDHRVEVNNFKLRHARSSFFSIVKYFLKIKPGKILVFNHQLAIILIIVKKLLGVETSIIARNINTLTKKRDVEKSFWHKHIVFRLVKWLYPQVNHVIAQSEGMKEDLILNFGFDSQQVTVINNPLSKVIIEKSTLHSNSKEIVKNKRKKVLFVGKFKEQKGLNYLLESFSLAIKDFEDMDLYLFGDGPLKENLLQRAEQLRIKEKVHFEGFTDNIFMEYANADVTVLTSLYEGFPNVLIESIAMGTPVVSFDCPSGPREIINAGENGYLVEYLNVDDFAQALVKALKKDWNKETIKNSAKKYYPDSVISKYISVIKDF